MNSEKILKLTAVVFLLAFAGCAEKAEEDTTLNESTEFFKEIENMAISENAESLGEQQVSNSETGAMPSQAENGPLSEVLPPEKPSIQDIQQCLRNANFYAGKLDGVMGPKTKKAVESFQANNGLKSDGKVGPKTWSKLKEYYKASAVPVSAAPQEATEADSGVGD